MDYLSELLHSAVWDGKLPDSPEWVGWKHRSLSENHCEECLKLDGCWFLREKTPKWPHHNFCHCILEPIPYNDVLTKSSVYCAYSKFDPYLFNVGQKYSHHKEEMFESWGYTVEDSEYLRSECEKQAIKKYINGDYELSRLDEYGQRINIRVEIPRKDKEGSVSFITGWMTCPDGHIKMATPYGDD